MIRRFLGWLRGALGLGATVYRMTVEPDVPDRIAPKRLYVVGDPGHYWLAVMKCPVGATATFNCRFQATIGPDGLQTARTVHQHCGHRFTERPGVEATSYCAEAKVVWCR